jgi:hypothetical protein
LAVQRAALCFKQGVFMQIKVWSRVVKVSVWLTASAVLFACGGGGGDNDAGLTGSAQQLAASPRQTALGSSADSPSAGSTKILQTSDLQNLNITADPNSGAWNVRGVVGGKFLENVGPGTDLNAVPRFRDICAANPAPCRFDTYAFQRMADGTLIESITAYGRYWNFLSSGEAVAGNGADLNQVPRYAEGPCREAVQSRTACVFESRTFGRLGKDSPIWVESITANGKGYNFDANGVPWSNNGFDLKSVPRAATGPCAESVQRGIACRFTARTFFELVSPVASGATWLEYILVNGRIWVYDVNGQQLDPSTFLPVNAPLGTSADQAPYTQPLYYGSITRSLVLPARRNAKFECNVESSSGGETLARYRLLIEFNDGGGYRVLIGSQEAAGTYRFNLENAQITFLSGPWASRNTGYEISDDNKNSEVRGQLEAGNEKLKLRAVNGTDYLYADPPRLITQAECLRNENAAPPPPGPGPTPQPIPTGGNVLIPDGQSVSQYKCSITNSINLGIPGVSFDQQIEVGDVFFSRDGTYRREPFGYSGSYVVDTLNNRVQFTSGQLSGDSRTAFASFPPQDPGRLSMSWYLTLRDAQAQRAQAATCIRVAPTKDAAQPDPAPAPAPTAAPLAQNTITLIDYIHPCANLPDANQCAVNRWYTFMFGREGEAASLQYWGGVNMPENDKRKLFGDLYKDSAEAGNIIAGFYRACLLREPEPAGLAHWRGRLVLDGIFATAQQFANSDEAVGKGRPCAVAVAQR